MKNTINLNSPQEFKNQLRELILQSSVKGIVADKMKDAAKK